MSSSSITHGSTISIPWYYATYIRKTSRDRFVFSHLCKSEITKTIPCSLQVQHLRYNSTLQKENINIMKQTPLLVLVTGDWAQNISLDDFFTHRDKTVSIVPLVQYDHLHRLQTSILESGSCSELSKDYRILSTHSTLTHYQVDSDHSWIYSNSIPMLSDMVLLPRVLSIKGLNPIMAAFCRAAKKSFKDSLLIAGENRYKEDTLALVKH